MKNKKQISIKQELQSDKSMFKNSKPYVLKLKVICCTICAYVLNFLANVLNFIAYVLQVIIHVLNPNPCV